MTLSISSQNLVREIGCISGRCENLDDRKNVDTRCLLSVPLNRDWEKLSNADMRNRKCKRYGISFKRITASHYNYGICRASLPSTEPFTPLPSAAEGSPEQATWHHRLPSGLRLEVIEQKGRQENVKEGISQAPLVFVHGSYHAAWCYAEHWLPYFSKLGHDCYSLSLLGQGGSDVPDAPIAGTIQSHAADVAHFITNTVTRPPVLIGHSFGGLILQAYLADISAVWPISTDREAEVRPPYPSLAAAILACSVPPTGNSAMVLRFMRTRPVASFKILLSLAAKQFTTSLSLCRESFFSSNMPDKEVLRYQALLKESSKIGLFDLRKLNASLPVARPPSHAPAILVIGAANDYIVDEEGLIETGQFYNTPVKVIQNIAHDIMLDIGWEEAAGLVLTWLKENGCSI